MAQILQMRNMALMGVTSTSIYSSVSDNSEDSESPWPLKFWARLEGQIRNEKGSQKNALQSEKWGRYRKPEYKHLPGMETVIWDRSSQLHMTSPNLSSLSPPNNSTDCMTPISIIKLQKTDRHPFPTTGKRHWKTIPRPLCFISVGGREDEKSR